MTTRLSLRSAILGASLVLLLPSVAWANGIVIEALIAYGLVVLAPVLAFITVVEAMVMARYLRLPWRSLWRPAMKANVRSGIVGVPVSTGNAFLASVLLPEDLHGYFLWFPWIAALGYANHFAVTLAVETLSWRRSVPVQLAPAGASWRTGLLMANLVTYLVLGPLHYLGAQPDVKGIASFEPTTEWAAEPATEIYFLRESDQHLMRVRSNGTQLVELVKEPIADYRIAADGALLWVKSANGSDLRLLSVEADGKTIEVVLEPGADSPPSPLYGPTEAQQMQRDELSVRAGPGLGNRLAVEGAGGGRFLLATNPGFWFPFSTPWAWRPGILPNGREVLFVWGSGIYLLDLDGRRIGQVGPGVQIGTSAAYTILEDSFVTDDPLSRAN